MTTNFCPKCCNGLLTLRKGKYGDFLGCTNYPKCKHTEKPKFVKVDQPIAKPTNFENFQPSEYQKKIHSFFVNSSRNMMINATAGSGKTTLLLWLMSYANTDNILFLAFNKSIANELSQKIVKGNASTLHSLGFSSLKNRYGKIKVDNYKVINWLRNQVDADTFKLLKSAVPQIVSKYKNVYADCQPNDQKLSEIIDRFDIQFKSELLNEVYQWSKLAIQYSAQDKSIVDFDDMIWLSSLDQIVGSQYDIIFVDESQDLNNPQIAMLENLAKRYIFVGDSNQAIYGFRGANVDAMNTITQKFDCIEFSLPLTYRNSKAVTVYVNDMLPDIDHICLDNAPEGEVSTINDQMFNELVTINDMVICRNNAPLVKPCYALLRQGKKARIQGKDIGQNLINLIGQNLGENLASTLENLDNWKQDQIAKYNQLGYADMVDQITDKIDTIFSFAENLTSNEALVQEIDRLFADNGEGTVFSTIHKAKGLESDTVYIIAPEKLNTTSESESCISFVAYTRAKLNLYLVID